MVTRRSLLHQLIGASASMAGFASAQRVPGWQEAAQAPLSDDDDKFLEELEKASFLFFWEQGDPDSGLVKDRCNVRAADTRVAASIAATGFGLTAICIGQKRG